jgi:hypothetical protein
LKAARDRWRGLIGDLKALGSYGQLKTEFNYLDIFDYQLLQTALTLSKRQSVVIPQSVTNGKLMPIALVRARATEISDALGKYDRRKLLAIKAATLKTGGTLHLQYATLPSVEADIQVNLIVLKMVNDALRAIPSPINALLDIVDIDPREWQSRRLAAVNREIEERRQLLRLRTAAPDARLKALDEQRAFILGVLPEFRRRAVLQGLVVSETAAGNFKAMTDEIGFLDKQIIDAESVLKAAKKDVKAEDPRPALFLLRDKDLDVELGKPDGPDDPCKTPRSAQEKLQEKYGKWLNGKIGDSRPLYVIIIEPIAPSTAAVGD